MNTQEIINKGMDCLLKNLGIIETEHFVAALIRERFDYTKWRRDYFSDASVQDINRAAAAYACEHPFHPQRELQTVD